MELKQIVAYYRDYAAGLIDSDAELRNAIMRNLATERGYNAHEKDSCDWEVAVFDGMPVGASVTILTKMRSAYSVGFFTSKSTIDGKSSPGLGCGR